MSHLKAAEFCLGGRSGPLSVASQDVIRFLRLICFGAMLITGSSKPLSIRAFTSIDVALILAIA